GAGLVVQARLDALERDLAAHGLLLLGHPDDAEAALADLLQQLEVADARAGLLAGLLGRRGQVRGVSRRRGQERTGLVDCRQQRLDARAQGHVAAAGAVEEGRAFGRGQFDCVEEDLLRITWSVHDSLAPTRQPSRTAMGPGRSAMPRDDRGCLRDWRPTRGRGRWSLTVTCRRGD